jgi:hypothetical protein
MFEECDVTVPRHEDFIGEKVKEGRVEAPPPSGTPKVVSPLSMHTSILCS